MLEDLAPRPDWRRAESYRPLLRADAATWAWEFGRRSLQTGGGGDIGSGQLPDLCFAGAGPAGDDLPAALWTWRADPAVPVLSAEAPSSEEAICLNLARLRLPCLLARAESGEQHLMICDGERRLRLAVLGADLLQGAVILRYHLPALEFSKSSLQALRLLIGLLETGRLAPRREAQTKQTRWVEALRAHDARSDGASQRQIAILIFGEDRVREDWAGPSDYMRMRVHRLLRMADDLVAGGYRAMCSLRPVSHSGRQRLAEVWRSPSWLGARGDMAQL